MEVRASFLYQFLSSLLTLSNDGIEDQRQAQQYRWPAGFKQLKRKEKALPASLVHDARVSRSHLLVKVEFHDAERDGFYV